MTEIQSYVILDLETTGLPSTNYGETKITEISLLSVMRKHFDDFSPHKIPRVVNKLTMCFHPERFLSPQCENITGLSNDLLEEQGTFDNNFCDILINFIQRAPPPVCLLAHNGYRFDFPLIQAHTKILGRPLPEHILCADTWHAFKDLRVVEEEPPGRIPFKVFQPFSPPPDSTDGDNIWKNDPWESESELTSTALIKEVEKIEQSVYGECKGLSSIDARNKIFSSPFNRKTTDLSLPKFKRHSVPLEKPSPLRQSGVRRQLFSGSGNTVTKPSYKLQSVYKHLFNRDIPSAHSAEGDALAILHCVTAIGTRFHDWVQNNHRKLNSILKFW